MNSNPPFSGGKWTPRKCWLICRLNARIQYVFVTILQKHPLLRIECWTEAPGSFSNYKCLTRWVHGNTPTHQHVHISICLHIFIWVFIVQLIMHDRATERPSDRATERPSDRATERPSDRATDPAIDSTLGGRWTRKPFVLSRVQPIYLSIARPS